MIADERFNLFFQSLKRHYHDYHFRGKNQRNCPNQLSYGTLTFRSELQDCNSDFRRLNTDDFDTLCINLASFRQVISEIIGR